MSLLGGTPLGTGLVQDMHLKLGEVMRIVPDFYSTIVSEELPASQMLCLFYFENRSFVILHHSEQFSSGDR
jgi:hypothetical protein